MKRPGTPASGVRPKPGPSGKPVSSRRYDPFSPSADAPLHILMVTPEARPFAKTGGLADVAAALPQALTRLGHRVTLVLPRYRGVDTAGTASRDAEIQVGARSLPVTFLERPLGGGLTAVLVDVPALFDREELYGSGGEDYPDNGFRFAMLSRAALEYPRLRGERPSVVHGHDWQTGLVPVYQRTVLADDPVVGSVPCVFTVHNLAFQGLFDPVTLDLAGLPRELYSVDGLEFWGRISFLKGGINFSRTITTVSPTYAREVLTPELGFGFEGILARRSRDLVGILNGIDTDVWNPASDPYLSTTFTASDLKGKAQAKKELLTFVGLPAGSPAIKRPVIGLVSRLTDQKGFDLVTAAANDLMALDATWVMLGSGEHRYEEFWRGLAARLPDRVAAYIGFHERLAHLIEAGSDLFLMPSRFEPCGLNQMYSLRYGTLPVVRATGGLDDTVVDESAGPHATGFKFTDYSPGTLTATVARALATYRDRRRWKTMQRTAMRQDHSWDVSAREYVKVYRRIG